MKRTMILGLLLAFLISPAAAKDLKLRDGSTLKETVVVRMSPATYIVQTPEALYELSEDEIEPASLQKSDFRDARPPIVTRHYDEIHADGTATSYWTLPVSNHSKHALTEIRMGLAPWERNYVDQRTFVDGRGQTLVSEYDPPRHKWADHPDKRVQHNLQLVEPLAPGEEMTFTGRETSQAIRRTDEGLLYRYHGDFTEDRLVTLKVKLPQGAKVQRVSPQASVQFEDGGCTFLVWRRYYKKGEVFPLEVVYTLD